MNTNEDFRSTLLSQKAEIHKKIEQLLEDEKAIDRVLALTVGTTPIDITIVNNKKHSSAGNEKIKIAEFVRSLFNQDVNRIWSPTEIGNEIEKAHKLGQIELNSTPLRATHRIIRAFKKNNTIERVLVGGRKNPKYKKK